MMFLGAIASYDRGEILRAAEMYRSQGRIRKAIREYERILSVDRRDIDVHIKIAPLYVRAGLKDQAKDSLYQVVSWYEKRGFVEKAIATLRLTLTVNHCDLAVYMHLAELYLGKDHAGDARNILDVGRRVFLSEGYLEEALAVEEKILSLAPDDFPTQVSQIRLLWKTERKREMLHRLRCMEEQWARRGNKQNWRKTRRLLFRYTPSLSTGWGCFLSFFTAPVPYTPVKKGNKLNP